MDYHNEDGALDERLLYVVDAAFDEVGLTEDVGRDVDVCGQRLLKVVQCGVELLGEVDGAGIGLLGYGEEYSRVCPLAANAKLGRLVAYLYVGYIGKGYDALAVLLDDTRSQLLYVVGRSDATDDVLVAVLVAHATVGVDVHATGRSHDVGERNTEVLHLARTYEYLIFLDVAAMHAYLSHASGRKQARTYHPVGIGA